MQRDRGRRCHFNSRPRAGGRQVDTDDPAVLKSFQFPPPRGGRLSPAHARTNCASIFQFPPPRGGRPQPSAAVFARSFISIPAPRAGGDERRHRRHGHHPDFNSRPRVGGDDFVRNYGGGVMLFQFPPPRGGATRRHFCSRAGRFLFQFPPPRGGRRTRPATCTRR